MRVDHEKKSAGVRVAREKKSDVVRVHHEKERLGESSPCQKAIGWEFHIQQNANLWPTFVNS